MSKIAFKPEEATEALKEFVGQIVDTDYAEEPFGMKGAPDIKRVGKVLCVKVRTDVYDKDQFEWYPPSRVKKTKPVELEAVGGMLGDSLPAIDCAGVLPSEHSDVLGCHNGRMSDEERPVRKECSPAASNSQALYGFTLLRR